MTFAAVGDALYNYREQLAQCQTVIGQREMIKEVQILQRFFDQTLWPQVAQTESSQSQWQSAITEMHRHMRLLAIEVSFFQSARHSQTYQQRLEHLEQRLQQLQGFTQVLINLCE